MEILFGLHIAMGALKFSRVRLYWDSSNGLSLFMNSMGQDRFFQIRNNLHCVNELDRPAKCADVFFKVRPIYDCVRSRCLQLKITRDLSMDEQMIPFTGRMKAKQFVRGKPDPWGIKNVVLWRKNGIAYDFVLNQG